MSTEQEAMSFDDALASGDPDAIEAAMAAAAKEAGETDDNPGELDGELDAGDQLSSEGDNDAGEAKAKPEETAAPGGEAEAIDDDVKKVVLTKDGKHEIPYKFLEDERSRANKAEKVLAEQSSTVAELEKKLNESTDRLSAFEKAMEKSGIELPKDFSELSEADLDRLDEYEDVGPVVRALHNQVKRLESRLTTEKGSETAPAQSADVNPVTEIVANHPDLNSWMKDGGDKWDMALMVDDQLRADPNWQNKSLQERFVEVARRTKNVFGETSTANSGESQESLAAKKLLSADDKQNPPTSLTEIGKPAGQERSGLERLADIEDPNELHDRLEANPALLDQLYASLD